ncbi:MAG TPA: DUF1887 family CARF protein [Ktedonobacteraceae bacterium]|nr:DUF1887 family CARF protein [Ktedonobacteraceae bacterium]
MTKALLTLFGGRSFLPTALLVIHEKPNIVVAISSKQSHDDLPQLKQAIDKFQNELEFTCHLETPEGVDAFDVNKIQQLCENAISQHLDAEWIFDITGGTSLMSIAAYEAARKSKETINTSINCWYLNTAQTRVISLVGKMQNKRIFQISVDGYAAAYKHTLQAGTFEGLQNSKRKDWFQFAQRLGKNPSDISLLKTVMNKIIDRPGINNPRFYTIPDVSDETFALLEEAQLVGLLSLLSKEASDSLSFRLTHLQDKFLNGAWLEAYVWDEACKLYDETGQQLLFDDCKWNQSLDGDTNNELDVAMTYKAQLIIAECKTGERGTFAPDTLYKWDSVANSFGGKFVGKLLITSLQTPPETERGQFQSFKDFLARAHSKSIVVVTAEKLPVIGEILKREAINPTYPRI